MHSALAANSESSTCSPDLEWIVVQASICPWRQAFVSPILHGGGWRLPDLDEVKSYRDARAAQWLWTCSGLPGTGMMWAWHPAHGCLSLKRPAEHCQVILCRPVKS